VITASGLNCTLTTLDRIPVDPSFEDAERMKLQVPLGLDSWESVAVGVAAAVPAAAAKGIKGKGEGEFS
jgi:hypothetical protein